jgi:formylmethanofuran dehydrogenase subunit E
VVKITVDMYPTAICRKCGEPVYHGEGTVNKKGEWACIECRKLKSEGEDNTTHDYQI